MTRRSASPSAIWPHGRWRLDFCGRGQPRRHHPAGRPPRPDADVRRRGARRAHAAAGRTARVATSARSAVEPERRQRHPLAGRRPGSTPAPPTRPRWRPSVDAIAAGADAQRRDGTHPVDVDAESVTPVVDFPDAPRHGSSARWPTARRRARCCRPAPATTPVSCRAKVPTAMLFVRNPTGVSHSPAEHAETPTASPACEALADGAGGLGARVTTTTWWCEHAWLADGAGRRRRARSPSTDGVITARRDRGRRRAGDRTAARPGAARARQRPLARLPPGAARRAPTRPRHVLDLARADVRRRRPADPDTLPRAGPGRVRRDGAGRHHLRRRVPLPAPRRRRRPYADPNAMGAGADRRRRATPASGSPCSTPATSRRRRTARRWPTAPQQRFGDGDGRRLGRPGRRRLQAPRRRTSDRRGRALGPGGARRRAWPPSSTGPSAATRRCTSTSPSSPPRTTPCLAVHGCTPDRAARRPRRARAAHHRRARHPPDRRRHRACARTGTGVCFCPTTERDLADGIGPLRALADGRVPLSLGSRQPRGDRPVRGGPRRRDSTSGWSAGERGLLRRRASCSTRATADGHRALGWPDAGRIARGARADLVAVDLDSVAPRAAAPPSRRRVRRTAADVTDVVVDGRRVVADRTARGLADVGALLAAAIAAVMEDRMSTARHRHRRAGHQRRHARRRLAARHRHRRRARRRRRPGRLGRPARAGARRRRARRPRGARGHPRIRRQPRPPGVRRRPRGRVRRPDGGPALRRRRHRHHRRRHPGGHRRRSCAANVGPARR